MLLTSGDEFVGVVREDEVIYVLCVILQYVQ